MFVYVNSSSVCLFVCLFVCKAIYKLHVVSIVQMNAYVEVNDLNTCTIELQSGMQQ
jgi:hypothetical protein